MAPLSLKRTREISFAQSPDIAQDMDVELPTLPDDIYPALIKELGVQELLHFRAANLTFKQRAEKELVLRLNNSAITLREIGIKTITEALIFFGGLCDQITRLDLREFYIEDAIWTIFYKFPNLEVLLLNESPLTHLPNFTKLKILELYNCRSIQGYSVLTNYPLKELVITQANLSLDFLTGCPQLTKLSLAYSVFEDLEPVAYCRSLKELDLTGTCITDTRCLKKLPLETLILKDCELINLKVPKALKHLDIRGTRTQDFDFLQDLSLEKFAGDELEDLSSLKQCKELFLVNLNIPLIEFPFLETLTIENSYTYRVEDFTPLKLCRNLTNLNLSETSFSDLNLLVDLPLKKLNISGCNEITKFSPLNHYQTLTHLDISQTNFKDITYLLHLPLESLNLTWLYATNYEELGKLKLLKELHIEDRFLNNIDFVKELKSLEVLSLSSCAPEDFSPIGYCRNLKELDISKTHVKDLPFLKNLKFLRQLNICDTPKLEDISIIESCKMLVTLKLTTSPHSNFLLGLCTHRTLSSSGNTEISRIMNIEEIMPSILKAFYRGITKRAEDWLKIFAESKNLGLNAPEVHLECARYCHASEWENFLSCFHKAAEYGDSSALYYLGYCHERGIGMRADMREAFRYYGLSAIQGNSEGCYNLGRCYEHGIGTLKDWESAVEAYFKAGKHPRAQDALEALQTDMCVEESVDQEF